jgi:hypothetical protein
MPRFTKKVIKKPQKFGGATMTGNFAEDTSRAIFGAPLNALGSFIHMLRPKKGGSHQYKYYPETQASNEISASRKSDMLKKFGAILDRPAVILPYGFNARK